MTGRYEQGVTFVMKRTRIAIAVFAVMILAIVGLFRTVPSALAPVEDQGYVFVIGVLQDAAALRRTVNAFDNGGRRGAPASRGRQRNVGCGHGSADLLGQDQRGPDLGAAQAVGRAHGRRQAVAGRSGRLCVRRRRARRRMRFFFAVQPPPIEGLSNVGGFEMYVQSRGRGTPQELAAAVQKFVQAASKRKELAGVMSTYSANVPQMRIDLDREKAMTLGVPVPEVFETLQSTFGALYVNDFNRSGRVYQVQLQSEPRFRAYPGGHPQRLRAREVGRARAADGARHDSRSEGPGDRRALQRLQFGEDPRRRCAGLQLGRRDQGDGRSGGPGAAAGLRARVDGHRVSGKGERRRFQRRLPARRADGVPDPRSAVRALGVAAGGHPGRAVRGLRRVRGGLPASTWRTTSTSRSAC